MSGSQAEALVRGWSGRFRKDALAANAVTSLRGRSEEIWRRTFELLQRESPEYRNSVDDDFTRESKSHCGELLATIIAVAGGRTKDLGADPFAFVRSHAEWRARHHVPLIASLHAYRLAHRTYWGVTREALLQHAGRKAAALSLAMLSDFWMELFDYVGTVLSEAHAVEEGLIVAQGTRAYVGLIEDLLRGHPPRNGEAMQLAALCGIRPGAPMAIAVLRPCQTQDEAPLDLEVRLRSLSRLVGQVLPSARFGKLVDIRTSEVMAIICNVGGAGRGFLEALGRSGARRPRVIPAACIATHALAAPTAVAPRCPIAVNRSSPASMMREGFRRIALSSAASASRTGESPELGFPLERPVSRPQPGSTITFALTTVRL